MDVTYGVQEPTFEFFPKSGCDFQDAEDAITLAERVGINLLPWQQHVLRRWMARTEGGLLASTRGGLSVPRQNGKNEIVIALELYQLVVEGKSIAHTAHETKTSDEAFDRLSSIFEMPSMKEHLLEIRRANGQQSIRLKNGGKIRFIARTRKSSRGFTVDTVIIDEAQEFTELENNALSHITTAPPKGESFSVIMGTPPSPADSSEVFDRTYEPAHDMTARRVAWLEWAATDEDDPEDIDVWAATNPSLGYFIKLETVEDQMRDISTASFQRDRLGVWGADTGKQSVLDYDDWNACFTDHISNASSITLSVDVSPDRKVASLVASGQDSDGLVWVDLIENREGPPTWVVPRIRDIVAIQDVKAVVIDAYGSAQGFIEELSREGITVTPIKFKTVVAATASFHDAVVSRQLRHIGQPALTAAALSAGYQKTGDSWKWGRPSTDVDISPLIAATLAAYGNEWSQTVRPVKRKRTSRKRRVQRMVVL